MRPLICATSTHSSSYILFFSRTSFCRRSPPRADSPSGEAEQTVSSLMWVPTAKHKLIPALVFLFLSPSAVINQSKDSPSPYSSWERTYIPVGHGSKSRNRRYLIDVSGSGCWGYFSSIFPITAPSCSFMASTAKKPRHLQLVGLLYIEIHLINELCKKQPLEFTTY